MLDMPRCASRNVFVAALTDITVAFYKTHFADIGDMQQMKISDYFSWWLKITFDLSNVATDQLDSEMSKVQPFVSVSSAYLGLVLSSPEPLLLKRCKSLPLTY